MEPEFRCSIKIRRDRARAVGATFNRHPPCLRRAWRELETGPERFRTRAHGDVGLTVDVVAECEPCISPDPWRDPMACGFTLTDSKSEGA